MKPSDHRAGASGNRIGTPSQRFALEDAQGQERIERLFQAALSLASEERALFLNENCLKTEERAEVERLLKFHDVEGGGLSLGVRLAPSSGAR